jgi:hypothetical protein
MRAVEIIGLVIFLAVSVYVIHDSLQENLEYHDATYRCWTIPGEENARFCEIDIDYPEPTREWCYGTLLETYSCMTELRIIWYKNHKTHLSFVEREYNLTQ